MTRRYFGQRSKPILINKPLRGIIETYAKANISTTHSPPRQNPRVPSTRGIKGWPPCAKAPSCEGPSKASDLINIERGSPLSVYFASMISLVHMIPVKFRFHGHGSLRYLFKNGQAVRSRRITVKYITNPKRKHPRFAVVVSKKVHKSAVGRNRMRRRLYEIIRKEQPQLSEVFDIAIIITNAEVMSVSHDELFTEVRDLFVRAGMYSDTH